MNEEDIESLKSYYEKAKEVIKDQHNEIERLNNIINELEKWLDYKAMIGEDETIGTLYYRVLDKLEEIKKRNN